MRLIAVIKLLKKLRWRTHFLENSISQAPNSSVQQLKLNSKHGAVLSMLMLLYNTQFLCRKKCKAD
jgi:hypothetical protein